MSIISNAKEIADLIKNIGDIELYRKIVELEGEIIELTRKNRELEDQVDELKNLLETVKKMQFRKPFCYIEDDTTPFCPRCWEVEKLAIHLVDLHTAGSPWKCKKCSSRYSHQ
jgi:hypothetical protein